MLELLAVWPGQPPTVVRGLERFQIAVCDNLCADDARALTADVVLFGVPPPADALARLHELRAEAPVAVVLAGEGAPGAGVAVAELDLDGFVDLRWPTALLDATLVTIVRHVNLGRNVTLIQQKVLQEARVEAESLYHQAVHDGLTGLYNRRHLDEVLPREHERARRTGSSYAVIILDVDDLKRVNTDHGHSAGSAVLRAAGALVAANVRLTDYGFRYGGDEFVILLTNADQRGARRLAEQLVEALAGQTILHDGASLPCSVSAGVASFPADAGSAKGVFSRADAALFEAKGSGKHQVLTASALGTARPQSLANR